MTTVSPQNLPPRNATEPPQRTAYQRGALPMSARHVGDQYRTRRRRARRGIRRVLPRPGTLPIGRARAAQICAAALPVPVTALVRVPAASPGVCVPLLDRGCQGIIAPHVDTATQAREVVARSTYPPTGERSVTGGIPQLGYDSLSPAATARLLNPTTLVAVMVESEEAIVNASAIAAVDGVDLLLVGTSDLSHRWGCPATTATGGSAMPTSGWLMPAPGRPHSGSPGWQTLPSLPITSRPAPVLSLPAATSTCC